MLAMNFYIGCATKASKIKWILLVVSLIVGNVLIQAMRARSDRAHNDYGGADLLLLR